MTRDEIIKGLEREVKSIRREPKEKMLGIFMTVDEAEDIVALLKEQEAKLVLDIADSVEGIVVGKCPRCDRSIVSKESKQTKFCKYCGQEVKWE